MYRRTRFINRVPSNKVHQPRTVGRGRVALSGPPELQPTEQLWAGGGAAGGATRAGGGAAATVNTRGSQQQMQGRALLTPRSTVATQQ